MRTYFFFFFFPSSCIFLFAVLFFSPSIFIPFLRGVTHDALLTPPAPPPDIMLRCVSCFFFAEESWTFSSLACTSTTIVRTTIAGDHGKWDQILLVKKGKYIGFCVYRRSCLLRSPLILISRWALVCNRYCTRHGQNGGKEASRCTDEQYYLPVVSMENLSSPTADI